VRIDAEEPLQYVLDDLLEVLGERDADRRREKRLILKLFINPVEQQPDVDRCRELVGLLYRCPSDQR
jgi:hypothetical protein